MNTFEIYFKDLSPEAQKAYLEFIEVTDPEEANLEFFPITIIEK